MKDPYKVMGVPRDASAEDIKRAYRQRAKDLHPDLNAGDAAAAGKFQELQAAYDRLTDPDGAPSGTATWTYGDGLTPEDNSRGQHPMDLFGDIAGNRRGRVSGAASTSMFVAGEDLAHPIGITKEEAADGTHRTIELHTGQTVAVDIMAGAKAGDVITVPGLGFPGMGGGPPGNLNVILEIMPTPEIGRGGAAGDPG